MSLAYCSVVYLYLCCSCSCSCRCLSNLSIYLPTYLSIYPSIYLSTYLSIYLSLYIYLSIDPSIHPSIYLSICLPVCLSVNEAILRDFLNFWTWQRKKRSYSARLPQFLTLATQKTQQFCETSSIFQVDDIKKEAIVRDFLQKLKIESKGEASYQCVLQFFHSICLGCCACHEKVRPGHTKCCTYHAKSP